VHGEGVQLADAAAFADGVAERLIPANYRVDAVPRIVRSSPACRNGHGRLKVAGPGSREDLVWRGPSTSSSPP